MSPPEDLLDVLHLIADVLEGLEVPYVVGGAIAQNFWGTVRATQDIDILASIPRLRYEDPLQNRWFQEGPGRDAGFLVFWSVSVWR